MGLVVMLSPSRKGCCLRNGVSTISTSGSGGVVVYRPGHLTMMDPQKSGHAMHSTSCMTIVAMCISHACNSNVDMSSCHSTCTAHGLHAALLIYRKAQTTSEGIVKDQNILHHLAPWTVCWSGTRVLTYGVDAGMLSLTGCLVSRSVC